MAKIKDIRGRRFNRLVAVRFLEIRNGHAWWLFKCDCGNVLKSNSNSVKSGDTVSCGCWRRERIAKQNTTHGHTKRNQWHPLYRTWSQMKNRCENKKSENFHNYGGRGIRVIWKTFEDFFSDMRPSWKTGLSIDRIDNDGNYCKSNCRWATQKEQLRNTRVNHLVDFQGEKLPLIVWSERTGLDPRTLLARLRSHWSIEKALTTPTRTVNRL